jgi:cytochrome c-type biogenesis protein CcmH/NrfG
LFAVHPVTVEAVNSIALGRGYLLATLFGLAAARLAVAAVGPAGRRWLWAVAIVSLGALFSHEIGAAAIGFMVVVWLAADEHRQPLLRHAARGALTVTALLIALLLAWVASDASLPHGVIATAATVSALSVKQLLAPVTLCLWFDAAAVGQPAALGPAAGVAMIAAIILIGFTYREGGRLRLLSVLLVLVALAPVLVRHLLPFPLPSVLGERWLYLPAAFVAVWVGLLAQPWWEARRDGQGLRRRFVAALLLALLCLAGVSGAVYGAVQSRHWRDNVTLFAHAVQHCPASAYLHAALGKAYFDQKEMESAREQFQSAAAIDPTFARARIGLGLVALERGQLIGALRELSSAIALAPNDADAHNSLGELYLQLRRGEAALHEFQQAVALRPWHVVYRSNLAVAYAGVGRVPEAITQWEQVLTMSPDPAEQEAARRRIDQLR